MAADGRYGELHITAINRLKPDCLAAPFGKIGPGNDGRLQSSSPLSMFPDRGSLDED